MNATYQDSAHEVLAPLRAPIVAADEMADGYARLEPPTPPTGNKKPPPAINKVASYLRTSAYFDAIEQLADDEVLSGASCALGRVR